MIHIDASLKFIFIILSPFCFQAPGQAVVTGVAPFPPGTCFYFHRAEGSASPVLVDGHPSLLARVFRVSIAAQKNSLRTRGGKSNSRNRPWGTPAHVARLSGCDQELASWTNHTPTRATDGVYSQHAASSSNVTVCDLEEVLMTSTRTFLLRRCL